LIASVQALPRARLTALPGHECEFAVAGVLRPGALVGGHPDAPAFGGLDAGLVKGADRVGLANIERIVRAEHCGRPDGFDQAGDQRGFEYADGVPEQLEVGRWRVTMRDDHIKVGGDGRDRAEDELQDRDRLLKRLRYGVDHVEPNERKRPEMSRNRQVGEDLIIRLKTMIDNEKAVN